MEKIIAIVHYNTPRLTECLVMSINKFVEDAKIYIFDNSDKYPFSKHFENVTILDNTKGQIVNFDEWLKKYPNRNKSQTFSSAKHCYSVEKCMDIINKPFVLMDSDILIKRNIDDLFNTDYMWIAETANQNVSNFRHIHRVLPYICFINTNMCKENNIHFFNENLMLGLVAGWKDKQYDTGASFLHDTQNFPHKKIKVSSYAEHFGSASWPGFKSQKTVDGWINKHKNLWSDSTPHPQNKTPNLAKTSDLGFWTNLDY